MPNSIDLAGGSTSSPRRSVWIAVGLWLGAIGSGMLADYAVAQYVVGSGVPAGLRAVHVFNLGPYAVSISIADAMKIGGDYWYAGLMALVAVASYQRRPRWHAGLFIILCSFFSSLNGLIKWMTGRARPFKVLGGNQLVELQPFEFQPMYKGLYGLWNPVKNTSFPSGHAALAFAVAAGMAILFPRFRWLFYAIATLTAVERVLEGAHYLSDCIAAAALGVGGSYLLAWVADRVNRETPHNPVAPTMLSGT